jgi:hypothetical protein
MLEAENGMPLDTKRDPLPSSKTYRHKRPPKVAALAEACRPDSNGCFAAFNAGGATYEEWLHTDRWLLERYQALIAHAAWREVAWTDQNMPMPSYLTGIDGQLFLLLQVQALARSGEWSRARQLLNDDLSFWRMVLASSDMLITKMMATVAVNRHFKLGSMILRTVPVGMSSNVVPTQWSIPMSDAERSMDLGPAT